MKIGIVLLTIAVTVITACGTGEVSNDILLKRAQDNFQQNDYRSAVTDLKTVLQSQPDNHAATNLLATIYLDLDDGASAETVLLKTTNQKSLTDQSKVLLAKAYLIQKKHENLFGIALNDSMSREAIENIRVHRGLAALKDESLVVANVEFSQALSLNPASIGASLGLARIDIIKGDLEEAGTKLERILTTSPVSIEALLLAAELAVINQRYDVSRDYYDRVIDIDENNTVGLYQRSLVLIKTGDIEAAQADSNSLRTLYGGDNLYVSYSTGMTAFAAENFRESASALDRVLLVDEGNYPALYYSGVSHFRLGDNEVASQLINKFLVRYPDNQSAKNILAASLIKSGNENDAEVLVSEVLELQADDLFALNSLAQIYRIRGEYTDNLKLQREIVEIDPDNIDSYRNLADAYASVGDDDSLVKTLIDVVSRDESSDADQIRLIKAYLKMGDFSNAGSLADRFIEGKPNSIDANLLKAAILFETGAITSATKYFRKVLDIDEGNPSASSGLAAIAMQSGDFGVAEKIYESSLVHYPKSADTLENLALVEDYLGKSEEAEAHLITALDHYPKNPMLRMKLAVFYRINHDYEAVNRTLSSPLVELSALERSLLIDAKMVIGQNELSKALLEDFVEDYPLDRKAKYSLAIVNYRLGVYDVYRNQIVEMAGEKPVLPGVTKELIKINIFDGNYGAADENIEVLYNLVGERSDVHTLRGDLMVATSNLTSAIESYETSFSMERNNISLVKLASALWSAGSRDKAIDMMVEWMSKYPDDNVIAFDLANRYLVIGNDDKAIEIFTGVIKSDPDNVIVLNNLAWLLKSKDIEAAREYAAKAVALAPNSGSVKDTYAMVLLSSGDVDKAKYFVDKAHSLDTENASIKYHRALILSRLGDDEQARSELSVLLQSDMKFDERKDAEVLLREIQTR